VIGSSPSSSSPVEVVDGYDGDEPAVTVSGWSWLSADEPTRHWALPDAPGLSGEQSYEEKVTVTEEALAQAASEIRAKRLRGSVRAALNESCRRK
jgi:hypothetical protein